MDLSWKACAVPQAAASSLEEHFRERGVEFDPQYAVAADLDLQQRYGKSYLVVSDGRVAVCDLSGRVESLSLSEIREVKVDELFGGARLVAVLAEGERRLISYTKVCIPEFSVMSRVLNDLIHGRTPEFPEEDECAYCRRCGAPLPGRGENCPICVPRLEILRRILGFVRPYRGRVAVLMVSTFVTVGSQMGPPYLTKLVVDDVIERGRGPMLYWYVGGMLACGLLLLISRFVNGTLTSWLAGRVTADIRERLHGHIESLQLRYFNRRESGELVARVMHDTGELRGFLVEGLPYLLVNGLSFVTIAVILFNLDARLTVFVLLPVPFLIGGGGWFWSRLIPLFHKFGNRMGRVHTLLGETIHGIRPVKILGQEGKRAGQFNTATENLFRISFSIDRTFTGFFEVMFWIMSLGVAGVWFFAAGRIAGGDPTLTLGTLLAFVGYIWLFYGPLQWFTTILNWMTHAFSGAERIFGILDSPPEVHGAPDSVPVPRIEGAISFRNVHFSYERGKEVIKDASFDIAPGEMVGLVGKSGAGKSTIINLVCRFYDVDSGQITVDGHPIRKIELSDLRRQIGIVMQEPFLFNATIMDNIRYGTPDATFEDVVRAARAARAHEFILEKEDGYDTYIGEGGENLSVGEKQRIAVAQAILHDPAILILDEATSSVDSETEKAIQEAIANLVRDRTTIAIAHRLATLRNANRLIVIEDGKVAEIGTHDELIAKEGIYAKLVQLQTDLSRLRATVWQE